jgi:threonine/homoserine efflux transporter RhtA
MLSVDGSRPYPKERPVLRPMPNRYGAVFAAVAVAQLLDLATFVPAVAHVGIGAESNPLARSLYLSVGPLGPAALKAAAIAFILLALLRVVRRFPTYALPSAALMVGIGLFGAASNLLFGLLR